MRKLLEAGTFDRRGRLLNVLFKDKDLRECANELRKATKLFGRAVGRKYIDLVNLLQEANSIQDIKEFKALRLHALRGQRKGQHAIDLNKDKGVRLIIVFRDSDSLMVEEVNTNHYA